MIKTSYFAGYKGTRGVSIARWNNWWKGETYKELAPPAELLTLYKKGLISKKGYTHVYKRYLKTLDVHKVAKDLNGKVLLCYEKPEDFCHRHLVATWLQQAGYKCEEV